MGFALAAATAGFDLMAMMAHEHGEKPSSSSPQSGQ